MKIKDLVKSLEKTTHFKKTKEENKNLFLAAAFLIINLEEHSKDQIQLDYFLPSTKQIAAFPHPFEEEPKIYSDIISVKEGKTSPKKIKNMSPQTLEINPDLDTLKEKILKTLKKENSALIPKKIIAILKDDLWNLTLIDNALGIVRLKINTKTGKTQDLNKGSLMDFMGFKKK